MSKTRWIFGLILIGLITTVAMAEEREVIFSDDFSQAGEKGAPSSRWSAFQGHWFIKDGVLHQDNGGFDHGMVVNDLYLRCDYRMEVKVRLMSGGAGAGFYWNMFDALTGETGNMLRYDGNYPIMFGWMRGRGFVGTGGATGSLMPDKKWHTMRMDIKNSTGKFDVYWDGKKIVDGADSFHKNGYPGLQCSLGYCEFDDFEISVVKGTDWRASTTGKVTAEWIKSIAVLPDGNLVYPIRNMHRIQIVTPEGKLVREFGKLGTGNGELSLPECVTTDKNGNIYVTEVGNNRIQVFSADGKSLKTIKPEGENAFKTPFGIAVDGAGIIWVGDTALNRIIGLKADGSVAAVIGKIGNAPGQFNTPMHMSIIEGKLYVADSGNKRLQIIDPKNPDAEPKIIKLPSGSGPMSVAYNGKDTFVVSLFRGLATYDKNWKKTSEFIEQDASDDVWGYQSIFDKEGNIIIADWWGHRILFSGPVLKPVMPKVSKIAADSAVITWNTDLPTETKIYLLDKPVGATWPPSTDYSDAKAIGDGKLRTEHRVELTSLKPATRYTYAMGSPRKTIPEGGHSLDFRFCTQAPKGKMVYAEVPIAVLCYSNVTFKSRKTASGKIQKPAVRDEAWFKRSIVAHEVMRYFYWTNSYFRLDTRCYYLNVKEPTEFDYLGSSSEAVYNSLKTLAKKHGMKPTDFGAVIVVGGNAAYAYPWPTPWWSGKLTYTTGCCFCGSNYTWISTHEFHHLTEGWMRMIRFKVGGEGGYGHADMPFDHPGRFGENYDFLAHTLRYIPGETYLNLAVGKIVVVDDTDGDGVPDDAPITPFDEKRGKTSPKDTHSYKNGLNDLQNLTAEIFNPAVKGHKHPLLTKQINLKYPFAVFSYDYDRKKKTPTIDGKFSENEWDFFTSTPNNVTPKKTVDTRERGAIAGAKYKMDTYLNWDDDYIYVAAKAPFRFLISPQFDCNGDGYFSGHDNIRMHVRIPRENGDLDPTPYPANTILKASGIMVWDCSGSYPRWGNELFENKDDIKWAWGKDDKGNYIVELAVPRRDKVGLNLKDGEEMSVRLWFQGYLKPTEKKKDPRYAWGMFDSCEYGHFKLVK